MERVRRFVAQLIQADRFGGRFVLRDPDTLIVYDVPCWGEDQNSAVRSAFPECAVAMQSHPGSLSGFIVVIRSHGGERAWLWSATVGLALIGAAYSCVALQRGFGALP